MRNILSYILPVLLFSIIWGAVEFFVPVRYSDGNISVTAIGFLFSVISLISVALDIPAGRLSDWVGANS
jgi:MFS family permease